MSRLPAIRNQKNFYTGLLYVLIGGGFAIGALSYRIGDAARMGPGYFPLCVGVLLALFGVIVLAGSLAPRAQKVGLPRMDIRPIAWTLGSIVLFGAILQPMGLVLSLLALVIVSSMGSHEFRWKGAVLNALLLVSISLGAFIFGLHLQIPVWPSFIG